MTTHEKAQIEFHRVAEVTKEGSVLNLDAAISAYLSALTPPDVAGLVDELLNLKAAFASDGDNFGMEVSEAFHKAAASLTHLAAENALLREREGWKLVPVEPTWTMKIAGRDAILEASDDDKLDISTDDADASYRAMLTYSPSHQEQNNG